MRFQRGRQSSSKVDLSYGVLPGALSKPEPPDDLWEQFDEALKEASLPAARPPGSFTVAERAEAKGIGRGAAARQVRKLLVAGKIKKVGQGNAFYYVMVK